MTKEFLPPSLTNWERWELSNFNGAAGNASTDAGAAMKKQPPAHIVPGSGASEPDVARTNEAARREGYQAGFDAGRADGLHAGREAAAAEGRQLAARLAEAIATFETGIAEIEHTVADEVLTLALEIARKVVHQTVAVRPQVILGIIRDALSQLPSQHAVIHLNAEDAALVRSSAGEQLTRAGHRIQEDPQLARGDVVIEAGGAHLDARLATHWHNVVAALDRDTSWIATDETEPS